MIFNSYIWELYKESRAGQETIAEYAQDFDTFKGKFGSDTYEILVPAESVHSQSNTVTISIAQIVYDAYSQHAVGSIDEAIERYIEMVTNGIPIKASGNLATDLRFGAPGAEWEWYDNIDLVTWGLYFACPEFFLPYLFTPLYEDMTFQVLEEICARFNIALPALPSKKDKPSKALYYGKLARTFYEFRQRHNLSPAEMCAFLYDFGLNVIGQDANNEELPQPSKVWLIKGGRGDFEFVDQATAATAAYRWGGNLEIRTGDILLMYMLSPHSYIHSIWRALSDGFADPFFHYHDAVAVGRMVKTPPVTFQELKTDPVLKQKGLIKANLQGASGDPFSVEEYQAILNIMAKKGQDISSLPKLKSLSFPDAARVDCERDVETFLVEPFLARLGYTPTDWIRQMPIKMGRGERNYPDYAFDATVKRGEESASMVLEAKYRISTRKELLDAFYQAKSYALRLQARHIVLCALDGVWIFDYKSNNFYPDDFLHKTWNELGHPDTLHQISTRIGRQAVRYDTQ